MMNLHDQSNNIHNIKDVGVVVSNDLKELLTIIPQKYFNDKQNTFYSEDKYFFHVRFHGIIFSLDYCTIFNKLISYGIGFSRNTGVHDKYFIFPTDSLCACKKATGTDVEHFDNLFIVCYE